MIKKTLTCLFVALLAISSYSQSNIKIPYSKIALGQLSNNNSARCFGMGGVFNAIQSKSDLNFLNPAALTAIEDSSFTFAFGAKANAIYSDNGTVQDLSYSTNLNYFGFAFPVTKWWRAGISLNPETDISYHFEYSNFDAIINNNIDYELIGTGGLNSFNITNAFKPIKNLSIGFNSKYNFGYKDEIYFIMPSRYDSSYYDTKLNDHYSFGFINFDFGAQYELKFNDTSSLVAGINYSNKKNSLINTTNSSWSLNANQAQTTSFKEIETTNNFTFPSKYGFGLAYIRSAKNNLVIAADINFYNWSQYRFNNNMDNTTDKMVISFGAEFAPSNQEVKNIFNTITYRIGGHTGNSIYKINNEELDDFGINLGLSIPLKKKKVKRNYADSYLNLSFELGQEGNIGTNTYKQNYYGILFGLTLKDFWFDKYKYQ